MWHLNPALTLKDRNPKRCAKFVMALAAAVASCLLWTGCNTMPQSAAASAPPATQNISIETPLPNSNVGSSYNEALSVRGGLAPYHYEVSTGQLPTGLALDSTSGNIFGTPTQAGNFGFTILVTSASSGNSNQPHSSLATPAASGTRVYGMTIAACTSCPTVQITPASATVAPDAKLHFTATVTNTGNTAVTWSASAGSISSSGLFTAPSSTGGKPVTVTARSVANSVIYANASVVVGNTAFAITTSSVPSAVEAIPYSTTLTAAGGEPPYQWSIVSGSLPPGLQLGASTGTMSGSATQSGSFPFTARATDSLSNTAQQNFTLVVSNGGQACGPPGYNCSRTDHNIVQLPAAPNVGDLSGANTIVADPNFSNRIVRITDANTNPEAAFKNRTYVTASSGSADDNLWNIDSTLLVVQDSGSQAYPYTFNPSTMQAARMYVPSFPTSDGLKLDDSGNWSRINPNLLYAYTATTISKYDFTDRVNPPASQPVYDFTSSRNCLPAGFNETWKTKGGVSGDDTVFGMAYSNTGGQGTGVYVAVYKTGSGCRVLNTQTGQVWGDWGTKGTINIPDRWTIHNVKLSKDGNWMVIVSTKCFISTCAVSPYFWQIGTTNVSSCGDGGSCSGHWTEGYSHWINNDNSPMSNQVIRQFAVPGSVSYLTNSFPPNILPPFDQHQSWNNVDPADSLPFFSSTWSSTTPFPAPWYNEIIAVAADGSGTTWRFAHTFITTQSQSFSTQYAIGSVSQDGKFFIFSSDWMGKLGSESGSASCTVGTNCRGDVFVVELK